MLQASTLKRTPLTFDVMTPHENAYIKREESLNSTFKIKTLLKEVPAQSVKARSKCFPKMTVQATSLKFNTSFAMGSDLCPKTPHHEQTLSRLGLIK